MTNATPYPSNPQSNANPSQPARSAAETENACVESAAQSSQRRRRVTLVIRAFVNEDGEHYGVVSDAGESAGWKATFSEMAELVNLVQNRLDRGAIAKDSFAEQEPAQPDPPKDDAAV